MFYCLVEPCHPFAYRSSQPRLTECETSRMIGYRDSSLSPCYGLTVASYSAKIHKYARPSGTLIWESCPYAVGPLGGGVALDLGAYISQARDGA